MGACKLTSQRSVMDFPLFLAFKINQIFWYHVIRYSWAFSDDEFGISMVENPYLDYLIVSNGSGLI